MTLENQIALCSQHYQKWKNIALANTDIFEAKKAMNRACFWSELQTAFLVLNTVEQSKGKDNDVKLKLMRAKANLSKKLANYAQEILNEIKI